MEQLLAILRRYLADAPTRQLADDDLWTRFRGQRDEAAFRVLLERVGGRIFARCRGILGDDHLSEEAFQEAFCALIRHRNRLPTYGAAVAWLYTTATNKARALARQRRRVLRREQVKAAHTTEGVPPASPEALRLEEAAALTAALVELPPRQRRALELVYLEGMTHDEAARALGWSRGTVGTYVSRGLEQLRVILQRRGLAALAGGAALEAALAVRAPALSPDRAATLAAGALKLVEMTPLLLVGKSKLLIGLTVVVGLAVGGMAYGPRQETAPPAPSVAEKPAAAEPAESVPERNLRLFRAQVLPAQLAALRRLAVGGGDVAPELVDAYDTRVFCRFRIRHRLAGAPGWASRLDLEFNTQTRHTDVYFDLAGDGQAKPIDPKRPIIPWRDPWTGSEVVLRVRSLEETLAAFERLPRDGRIAAEGREHRARLRQVIAPYLGTWYAKGRAADRWTVRLEDNGMLCCEDGRGYRDFYPLTKLRLDTPDHYPDVILTDRRVRVSADGRRLNFGNGDWWSREPVPGGTD